MKSNQTLTSLAGLLLVSSLAGCATDRSTSAGAAESATASVNAPPAVPDEPGGVYRQFDFWIGEWIVKNPDGQQVGTSRIEKVENGFAIEEFWTNMQGGTGRSLNYVDPKDGHWKQVWVSATGNIVYYIGAYRDGAMHFTGESINRDGTVEIARSSFTAMRNGSVRQFIEHSRDGGETWYVYFDGYYHPKE